MNNITDIIIGCKQNDKRSQTLLYNLFHDKLYKKCLSYFKDEDTAKDVLQESFITIFEKIKSYKPTNTFNSWAYRICTNKCIDIYRKSKKIDIPTELTDNNAMHDERLNKSNDFDFFITEERNILNRKISIVWNILEKMSPAYKRVFKMYHIEGCTHNEIAQELNVSTGTSKSNYHKARTILIDKLKKQNITL